MTRHVWQEALEEAKENRCTYWIMELYKYRKETIERVFALAKELTVSAIHKDLGRRR